MGRSIFAVPNEVNHTVSFLIGGGAFAPRLNRGSQSPDFSCGLFA